MLVDTFTAASLDPLLVGFLAKRASATLPGLLSTDRLSFSVVHESPARYRRLRTAHRVAVRGTRVGGRPSVRVPVLIGAPLVVLGRPASTIDVGDHLFVMVEVLGTRPTGNCETAGLVWWTHDTHGSRPSHRQRHLEARLVRVTKVAGASVSRSLAPSCRGPRPR